MNVRPPNLEASWEMNDVMAKAMLIAYAQIRETEEADAASTLAGKRGG